MELNRSAMIHDNRKISIQLENLTTKDMSPKGFTAIQGNVLLYILNHSKQGISLTEIQQDMGGSMASLSSMIKRLKKNGYVRVESSPGDDRKKLLFPTEKALEVREFLEESFRNCCDQVFDGFSDPEMEELERMQKKILWNLSKYAKNQ